MTLLDDFRGIATTVAVPHHEPPATVRRRRIVVVVVLVIGGALLGYSLTIQPGDSFTLAVPADTFVVQTRTDLQDPLGGNARFTTSSSR